MKLNSAIYFFIIAIELISSLSQANDSVLSFTRLKELLYDKQYHQQLEKSLDHYIVSDPEKTKNVLLEACCTSSDSDSSQGMLARKVFDKFPLNKEEQIKVLPIIIQDNLLDAYSGMNLNSVIQNKMETNPLFLNWANATAKKGKFTQQTVSQLKTQIGSDVRALVLNGEGPELIETPYQFLKIFGMVDQEVESALTKRALHSKNKIIRYRSAAMLLLNESLPSKEALSQLVNANAHVWDQLQRYWNGGYNQQLQIWLNALKKYPELANADFDSRVEALLKGELGTQFKELSTLHIEALEYFRSRNPEGAKVLSRFLYDSRVQAWTTKEWPEFFSKNLAQLKLVDPLVSPNEFLNLMKSENEADKVANLALLKNKLKFLPVKEFELKYKASLADLFKKITMDLANNAGTNGQDISGTSFGLIGDILKDHDLMVLDTDQAIEKNLARYVSNIPRSLETDAHFLRISLGFMRHRELTPSTKTALAKLVTLKGQEWKTYEGNDYLKNWSTLIKHLSETNLSPEMQKKALMLIESEGKKLKHHAYFNVLIDAIEENPDMRVHAEKIPVEKSSELAKLYQILQTQKNLSLEVIKILRADLIDKPELLIDLLVQNPELANKIELSIPLSKTSETILEKMKNRFPTMLPVNHVSHNEKEKALKAYRLSLGRELKRITPTEEGLAQFRELWSSAQGNAEIGESLISENRSPMVAVSSQVVKQNEVEDPSIAKKKKNGFINFCSQKFGNLFKRK